jgi:hypothetical protein
MFQKSGYKDIYVANKTHNMKMIIFNKHIYSTVVYKIFFVVVVSVLSQWICLGGHGYFHPTPED